jgi:predicted dehydrogenase
VAPRLEGPPANVAESYAHLAADISSGMRTVPDFARAAALSRLLEHVDTAAATGRRQQVAAHA